MLKKNEDIKKEIIRILPKRIREVFEKIDFDYRNLTEIRLRADKPILINYNNCERFINEYGGLSNLIEDAYVTCEEEIKELLQYVCNYSVYAYEEDIKQGFITIVGGHRIGLAGKVVIEGDNIKYIKNISCVNIRVSHQVIGCARKIMPYIFDEENNNIYHTLIVSPPMGGKTTLLRDIIRIISNESRVNSSITVGLVDERSEIAACYNGIPQNDIGIRTDIMDCCPKAEGMLMLLRSMSPKVIAVDEIGGQKDIEAIEYVINCGCKLLATVHGKSVEDIRSKPLLGRLVRERIFERYIILNNYKKIGNVKEIFDMRGNILLYDTLCDKEKYRHRKECGNE